MRVEQTVQLPVSSARVLHALADVSGKQLANIAAAATSRGEALLERSGLLALDEVNQCHFGAQIGRPVDWGTVTVLPLRWWNDKARSLTPGFIGELSLQPQGEQLSELAVTGEYHPRSHLYELVDRGFLASIATAVVSSFLDQLRDRILPGLGVSSVPAAPVTRQGP